jgi:glycosyltransferase involved in cell wall biosynthesis
VRRRALGILQVSTYDTIGGAEKIAWNLSRMYRARGYKSWIAVGQKLGSDPDVLAIPNEARQSAWTRFWWDVGSRLDRRLGIEDFRYPGAWNLLDLAPGQVDIVHCHNLHGGPRGGYFDLRALPWLSHQVPVVVTLHDAWLLSGHCAHSFGCERWKTGCGQCPDLTIPPAIRRDATAYNWRRKRDIFRRSRLYIATPSRSLMQQVQQSMLGTAARQTRVIPNGVDLSVFHPATQTAARAALELRPEALVILFAATSIRHNVWKDYQTVRDAVGLAAERLTGQNLVFLALGEDAQPERIGRAEVRFIPYRTAAEAVATCFQAADVYLHAARADTFPNTILEAFACGTPVVATAVGGIPEQVDEGRTGFLVPVGDPHALADRLARLLSDSELRRRMGARAFDTARRDFGLHKQANTYLDWYHELVGEPVSPTRAVVA